MENSLFPKLGILAGSGVMPRQLVDHCLSEGRQIFVVAFKGHTAPETVQSVDHVWLRLGDAGAVIDQLKNHGVKELVMTGPIRRPSIKELRPDWRGIQILAKLGLKRLGDDSLLKAVIKTLEDEGFILKGTDEFLKSLVAPRGLLAGQNPSPETTEAILRGIGVARALGDCDVGQAVVVQGGLVLAVEAIEGTDALIKRSESLKRDGEAPILVKLKKAAQERRVDLPTIGLQTIKMAIASGFQGIVLEAGSSLIADREEATALAKKHDLFVLSIEVESFVQEQS